MIGRGPAKFAMAKIATAKLATMEIAVMAGAKLRSDDFPRCVASRQTWQNTDGQIVVEYVILLAVAVIVAVTMTNLMVGRGTSEGFLIVKWKQLLSVIATDEADNASAP